MALKENDFVELDYTGSFKEDGEVFDTTDETVAKEHKLRNEKYGKVIICLGKGHLLKGLEKKIVGKELGKHKIELSAEEAFGKKNPKLLTLIPTQNFTKNKVRPEPGLPVNVDGTVGVVRSVTGGRTIVDFNHPLAGKDIVYDVNLHRIVSDPKEKVIGAFKILTGKEAEVAMESGTATITVKEEVPKELVDQLAKEIADLSGVKKVEFKKA